MSSERTDVSDVSELHPARPTDGRFRSDRPGWVHLLRHTRFGALKVGVSRRRDGAGTESIEADGWEPLGMWWFAVGYDALTAEEAVLDRWRNVFSLAPAVRPEQLLQSDVGETAHDTPSTRRDTIEFLDLLSRRAADEAGSPESSRALGDLDDPADEVASDRRASDAERFDPWIRSLRDLDLAS